MIKDNLIWKEVGIENCMQTALRVPFAPNKERNNFWKFSLSNFALRTQLIIYGNV